MLILAFLMGHFWPFWWSKSRSLDFLKVVLEMLRSWLGIIFGFKRPTFTCILSSKGRYLTSKIKNLCQNLALWEGHSGEISSPLGSRVSHKSERGARGCAGGVAWAMTRKVLPNSSYSSMLTSKDTLIWNIVAKMSKAFRSKVMINFSLKFEIRNDNKSRFKVKRYIQKYTFW